MAAIAAICDSREPAWVQNLQLGGIPVSVAMLDQGDMMLVTEDGETILVERKSLDDLLGSIKDGRIFVQAAEMQIVTRWRYVVVTAPLTYGANGDLVTARGETSWSFNSVWGALVTLQELGVFVLFCSGEQDYEPCLLRLANRKREIDQIIEPAKQAYILNVQEQVLASFPGIGPERVRDLMTLFSTPARALMALTDPASEIPGIKGGIKQRVRNALQLAESEQLVITTGHDGREWVEIQKSYIQEKINE